MTQGSILKSLVLYAVPIILSDFLQQLYNSADSIIVGNLVGKLALAAVGETFFIINIFLGLFLGVSLGTTVSVSLSFGARDYKRLSRAVDTNLKLTAILCVIFTVAGVLLVPELLRLVNTADDVYADAKAYLTVYSAGISTQLVYNMLSGLLKAIGDSRRPLYVLAMTAALNVALDYLFVGPFHMGVAGAAYATVISQAVSCIVLWILINRTPEFEKPLIKKGGLDKRVLRDVAKIGLPYSFQRAITAFSNTIVVSFVNYFGATAMASWTVYQKIDQFLISTMISLGAAITTFVSQNVGAGAHDRIKKGVNYALLLTLGISIFYALIFNIFKIPVISMFNKEEDVVSLASTLFYSLLLVHPTNAFAQIYSGSMRALGKNLWPTLAMVGNYVVVRQIYLYIRWSSYKDIMVVVGSFHFSWMLCAIACMVLYKIAYKQIVKTKRIL